MTWLARLQALLPDRKLRWLGQQPLAALPPAALLLQTRAKCWLFLSYIVAFAAVAGSAAVLIQCAQAGVHLWLGVVRPA